MKQRDAIAEIVSVLDELKMNEDLCRHRTDTPFAIRMSEIGQYRSNALYEIGDIVTKYNDEYKEERKRCRSRLCSKVS